MNYYNEWDKGAAAWLRELINNKLIPYGYVDERSITEVTPSDLEGFTQCHFFAGIGGWPIALQLAGVPESTRLWTGSPPCQPFSVAGQSRGFDDQRHLAPAFLRLIRECKPELLFGEQVAAAIGKHWLDFVFLNLEEKGYACGAAVLPACSVGAPHKRDRLFFGAHRLARTRSIADNEQREHAEHRRQNETEQTGMGRRDDSMADANDTRPQGRGGVPERAYQQPIGPRSVAVCLDNTGAFGRNAGRNGNNGGYDGQQSAAAGKNGGTNPHNDFWSDADWLGCRDGKFRPVEPGTFPLANGIPSRVGRLRDEDLQSHPQKNRVMRLRGYGNAIVPQVAAEFVKAFMEVKNAI